MFSFKVLIDKKDFINLNDMLEIINKLSDKKIESNYVLSNDSYKYYLELILYNNLIFKKSQVVTFKKQALIYYNIFCIDYQDRLKLEALKGKRFVWILRKGNSVSLKKAIYVSQVLGKHWNEIFWKGE
jgi:hypothetical protein